MDYMKLEFPSQNENIAFARAAVSAFVARLNPNLEELDDIKTALSEAVTNSIVHGYKNTSGTIYITCKILKHNIVEISIKDKGEGIENIEKAKEPFFTTGGVERGGMGFTIMESFMDKLKVVSAPKMGTTVIMTRNIISHEIDHD